MSQLQPNEYECDCCHEVFTTGWMDKEAEAELRDTFPDMPKEDCARVCDDCYNEMIRLNKV